jgi:hypothetical protein
MRSERAAEALMQLDSVPDLPIWKHLDSTGRQIANDAFVAAHLDNPTPMTKLRAMLWCQP